MNDQQYLDALDVDALWDDVMGEFDVGATIGIAAELRGGTNVFIPTLTATPLR
jgi:hypothetical protein